MKESLANIIRTITSKGKDEFVSSLREELDDRLYEKMANVYVDMCETLYQEKQEKLVENTETPVLVETQVTITEQPVNVLISSLMESIKTEKTILHHFITGESVAISPSDSKCLVNLHDSLNKMNQEKMRKLMSENYSEYNKILQFSKKHTERTKK